jgi:hypothetical protein
MSCETARDPSHSSCTTLWGESDVSDFFWGLVAFLALAAALNHSWHHARDSHLTSRLARVSYRDGRSTIVVVDADLEAFELD